MQGLVARHLVPWFRKHLLCYECFPGKNPCPAARKGSSCGRLVLDTFGSWHIYINGTYYYIIYIYMYYRYDDYCRWLLSYLYLYKYKYDTCCVSMIIIYIVLIVFIYEISAVIHRSSVFQDLDLGCFRSGDGKPFLLWSWRNDYFRIF